MLLLEWVEDAPEKTGQASPQAWSVAQVLLHCLAQGEHRPFSLMDVGGLASMGYPRSHGSG